MKIHFLLFVLFASLNHFTQATETSKIRIGYFPNLTHAQALIGLSEGQFQKALGKKVEIVSTLFNAGPSVVEAIFANEIDIAYIGPNPAVNAFMKSHGKAVRLISGVCSGGARLIIQPDSKIIRPADFKGKKIATPQLGNTQDVAARAWLAEQKLFPRERNGDVEILPIKNPDQLVLFQKKEIDAVWAVEPWASRLVIEAKGKVFLDERDLWPNRQFSSAVLVVSSKYLNENADIVKKWLKTEVELTEWIMKNPALAKIKINEQLEKLTGKKLSPKVLDEAFLNYEVTNDPLIESFDKSAQNAFSMGFLGSEKPILNAFFDLRLLNQVLKDKNLKLILEKK